MSDNRGRFVWHELMTTDTAAATAFYKEVVGWTTQAWGEGNAYQMWMNGDAPAGGLMGIPAAAAAMGAPPSWTAYLEVPDCDATIEQATSLGATVLVPAQTVPEIGRFAALRDPQGAVFAVITSQNQPAPESDPKLGEFSWHELGTTDWKAANEFYTALLGWEKKGEFDMGAMGTYYMFGRDRFTYGGMMNKPAEMTGPSYWLHYARVESADAAAERATAAGGTIKVGPMEVPGGDRIAILNDPQGAWFAVHSKA